VEVSQVTSIAEDYKGLLRDTKEHITTGAAYMVPVIAIGGLLLAISELLGAKIPANGENAGSFVASLYALGSVGDTIFIAVMAAFVAFAIADRPGLAPGLITGIYANTLGTGFLGALVAGFLSGYVTWTLMKKVHVHRYLQPLWVLIAPFFTTVMVGLTLRFVIGSPLSWFTRELTHMLTHLNSGNLIVLGLVIGLMVGFDFGGPINKVAFVTSLGLLSQGVYAPMSMVMVASPASSIGLGLATLFAPKKYTEGERAFGKAAVAIGGTIGFSEGAIPLAVTALRRSIAASMIGSAVAAVLAAVFHLTQKAPGSSIVGLVLVNRPVFFAIAILAGGVTTALVANLLKAASARRSGTGEVAEDASGTGEVTQDASIPEPPLESSV
jgi:fructose PTS system EIIBC or EIIC component